MLIPTFACSEFALIGLIADPENEIDGKMPEGMKLRSKNLNEDLRKSELMGLEKLPMKVDTQMSWLALADTNI